MSNDSNNSLSPNKEIKSNQVDHVPSVSLNVDSQNFEKQTELSFENISYTVQIKKNIFGTCRSKKSKTILSNVR